MIVILSNKLDRSTDYVIDWLNYKNESYFRINKETPIQNIQIDISDKVHNFSIQFENGQNLHSSEISSFWYRKDGISFQEKAECFFFGKMKNKLINFIKTEEEKTKTFIELIIQKKNGVGAFEKHRNINKLEVLLVAKQVGFSIPKTLVTNQKDCVIDQTSKVIIKAISEVFFYNFGKDRYITYTSRIPNFILNILPSTFIPSLFQTEIEKQYELRIFYWDKRCYGMAIFSQNDQQTTIDFRNYNNLKPNRCVPYKVYESFERKIIEFMEILGFNTGSLDFIVDKDNSIYFLEVNPSGQFGMVSYPCNYYLEKEIATHLINLNNENKDFDQ